MALINSTNGMTDFKSILYSGDKENSNRTKNEKVIENKQITKSIRKTIQRGVCFGGFIIFE
jgi:hypothetical protein